LTAATVLQQAHTPSLRNFEGEVLDFLAPPQGPGELGRLGPYRVLKVLGAGGMGLVLQAEDPLLKRSVALKVMRPELAKKDDARQRFLREARATAAIEHPYIVHVYQVGEDRGVPFLAMPFLKGESLDARLKREGKLSVAETVRLGRQIAEGLAAAHDHGLIHRDIKPGNIWLEPHDGQRGASRPRDWVKILDFGLARAAAGEDVHLTKTGAILGTPAYMAPEQARAEKVDPRCDLFSLGVVLYRMLTGTLPFQGTDTMSLLMALATDTPRPASELNPDVPPPLADLVTQLLAKHPAARPPSARAVADALAELEEGPTQQLASAAISQPARGGTRRPRWLVPLAAGGGLLGLFVIGLVFVLRRSGEPVNPPTAQPSEREKVITNSIGMKLVSVEPGVFLMGSPANEVDRDDEELQHEVEITRPFYVGVYEVTQEEYERIMGANPSYCSSTGVGKDIVKGMDTRAFPVENVSWKDAVEFCRRLSELPDEKKNEHLYRLPTEAEWEYICRGGPFFKKPSPPFYFGDSLSSTQANFNWNRPYGNAAKAANLARTTKVGSFPPNPLGIYDLHGNVEEWCADWHAREYYKLSPRQDPQGPDFGDLRAMRGGSWATGGSHCRAAYRHYGTPNDPYLYTGFRVVFAAGARN
jgi:serine/threonine protein kinase